MAGRASAMMLAAAAWVAMSCGGGSGGGHSAADAGAAGVSGGMTADGGAHEGGAGNPHLPAGGDGAGASADESGGESPRGNAGEGGEAAGEAGAGGDGGAGGVEPPKPPVQSCAPPEDASRWANGNTLYIGVDDQCGDLKPCFGSIYTATMTGGAKNGDTLVVLPGAHDRDIVYQTATLGDLRITSLDRDKTSFEKGLLVYGDIGAKGELWIDHLTFRKSGPVTSNVEDGWGIYVTDWDSVQVRIQDNVFADVASNGGLALSSDTVKTHFHAVVARNEFIHNTGPRGGLYIDVADESPDYCFRVENNVFTANTVGVSVGDPFGDPASQFEIVNNTIAGNDRGLEMSSGLTLKVTNNIVFANKQDLAANAELAGVGAFDHNLISSGQFTGLRGNFSADPLFADLNNADLHLLPGSPAAARGTVLPSPDTDLDGRARGVHPDVGAYERLEHRGEALAGLACGDGVVQWGAVQTPQGSFVGFETCDDGNRVDGDGCSSFCQLEARATLGQMSRAGSTGLCAIRSDRSLSCWDDIATGVPKGSFSQVVVGDGYACALDTAKLVQCWLPGGLKGAYAPSGQFLQIAQGPYE